MAKNKNTTVLNWEGEAGGRGIRALTRYIYQPPAVDNLTALNNVYTKMTGFFMVSPRCSEHDHHTYLHFLEDKKIILAFSIQLSNMDNRE